MCVEIWKEKTQKFGSCKSFIEATFWSLEHCMYTVFVDFWSIIKELSLSFSWWLHLSFPQLIHLKLMKWSSGKRPLHFVWSQRTIDCLRLLICFMYFVVSVLGYSLADFAFDCKNATILESFLFLAIIRFCTIHNVRIHTNKPPHKIATNSREIRLQVTYILLYVKCVSCVEFNRPET